MTTTEWLTFWQHRRLDSFPSDVSARRRRTFTEGFSTQQHDYVEEKLIATVKEVLPQKFHIVAFAEYLGDGTEITYDEVIRAFWQLIKKGVIANNHNAIELIDQGVEYA